MNPEHGLDVPKQIILSDHCFGLKMVHNFHRPDVLIAIKHPFRPWGIALLHGSPSSGFGMNLKTPTMMKPKSRENEFLKSPVLGRDQGRISHRAKWAEAQGP